MHFKEIYRKEDYKYPSIGGNSSGESVADISGIKKWINLVPAQLRIEEGKSKISERINENRLLMPPFCAEMNTMASYCRAAGCHRQQPVQLYERANHLF